MDINHAHVFVFGLSSAVTADGGVVERGAAVGRLGAEHGAVDEAAAGQERPAEERHATPLAREATLRRVPVLALVHHLAWKVALPALDMKLLRMGGRLTLSNCDVI